MVHTNICLISRHYIAEFIHALSNGLQIDLFDDRSLFDFALYFIEEIREGRSSKRQENGFLRQVVGKYPNEFRIVRECSVVFEKAIRLTLTDEDIAYLTMHVVAASERLNHFKNVIQILIVCPGNMATGQFLQAQIRRHFSYKIKAVCSVRELYDEEILDDVDLIISTVPVWDVCCPAVVVKPLLQLEDIQHIQEVAFQISSKNGFKRSRGKSSWSVLDRIEELLQQEGNTALKEVMLSELEVLEKKFSEMCFRRYSKLRELLSPDTVEIIEHSDTWENALRRAGHMLVRRGKITANYIDSCIRNCRTDGPYFVLSNGLAIAHTHPKDGLIEPGVSLLFIREGVSFGHKAYGAVRFLFFICLKESNNELLKFLINCVKDEELVKRIEREENASGIYEILRDYEILLERKG